ncbi:hypothetical protein F4824DRAFT_113936 [Ustulina deusta]|nr:hypothetical protein F4823DRAFT_589688 [Ustulina deusta]KAI3342593.1 hypothetical protein F4824DRAFT_113936 [Ustulina deusta]
MKFGAALFFMAGVTIAAAYDVSDLPNGVYKIPIADTGVIDYANAINLNLSYFQASSDRPFSRLFWGAANTSDIKIQGDSDKNDGNDDEIDSTVAGRSPSHCHWHYPHSHNRFITGHAMMNMTNYPLTLAMFMDWMSTGADGGWLNRGEVRMAKSNNVVVGACVFKKPRLMTCIHELSLAMGAADRECAAGKVGCHVCLRHWHKDYFRFATSEAPNQCECAWYYY